MAWAGRLGGYLAQVILMLFLIYFLLASGDLFKDKLVKLSGERLSQRKVTVEMIDEITTQDRPVRVLPGLERRAGRRRDVAGFPVDRRELRGAVGRGGRRDELHPVLRSDADHGRRPRPRR